MENLFYLLKQTQNLECLILKHETISQGLDFLIASVLINKKYEKGYFNSLLYYFKILYSDIVSFNFSSVQFSSVAQSWLTLCKPLDCSTPGLPVHHQLLEFTQTHVHWVSDATNHLILCFPLLLPTSIFPSIRVFFKWVSTSHQLAKVLEF